MIAIYKREFRSYFISMTGYMFVGFLLLIIGIMFSWISLFNKNAFIGYSLQYAYVTVVFMILVPMMTMKTFADERRTKTDQLLLTAPVTVTQIVMGKFLALVSVLAIPVAVICIYPILISQFGEVYYAESYAAILGFFLMGLCYLAIGMFISSVTENQVIAAVGTFAILLLSFMMNSLVKIIDSSAFVSFLAMLVILGCVAWFLYAQTKSKQVALIAGGVLEVINIALFVINPDMFEGLLQNIMFHLSLNYYYDYFVSGIFEVKAIVYYVTVAVFFVFLTVQSVQKRRWS